MLVFNPDSEILLCSTPLESDNKNQLHFANEAAQEEYFLSTVVRTYDGTTYQRKDDVIRINANIEDLYNCNYVMYQNRNFTNKWFYAFITDMSFLNNSTTAITIETDVFQTWLFDVEIKPSFVAREHTNDDTIGANIVPENLETGDYIATTNQHNDMNAKNICVAVSDLLGTGSDVQGYMLNGSYVGANIMVFPATTEGAIRVNQLLDSYANEGKIDAIVSVFMAPDFGYLEKGRVVTVSGVYGSLNGYVPRNKKLFTSQFYYLAVTNNAGDVKTFNFEFFPTPSAPKFNCYGIFNMMPSIWCVPEYGAATQDFERSLVITGFPQCVFVGDTFKNWLAQNSAANTLAGATAAAQFIGGAVTGNFGMAASGVMSGLNTLTKIMDHSKVPDSIRGTTGGNYDGLALGKIKFTFRIMSVKASMARIIDNYFDMFGYATNRVKIPNIGTRKNWNYVETQHINIVGDIPNDHMDRLKEVYNSGVTIWNNPDTFGDYSQANGVV